MSSEAVQRLIFRKWIEGLTPDGVARVAATLVSDERCKGPEQVVKDFWELFRLLVREITVTAPSEEAKEIEGRMCWDEIPAGVLARLSTRTRNALARAYRWGEFRKSLGELSDEELLATPGIGRGMVAEIRKVLNDL